MKGVYNVSSIEETWELAARFASGLVPGDIVCLEGDLGAGKTTFTQGICTALKLPGVVTSPTFCVVQEHSGENLRLVHMDLYRLRGEEDVLSVGWEDFADRRDIIVVEWPDVAGSLVPATAKHVVFRHAGSPESRRIEFK